LHGRRVFDIQNAKHAKAIRLKGEGFKPGEWKNKKPLHHLGFGAIFDKTICKGK
jgi:hypothetical protein